MDLFLVVAVYSTLMYGAISLENHFNKDMQLQLPEWILDNKNIQLMVEYSCGNKDIQLPNCPYYFAV
jgi:hypothetical protein